MYIDGDEFLETSSPSKLIRLLVCPFERYIEYGRFVIALVVGSCYEEADGGSERLKCVKRTLGIDTNLVPEVLRKVDLHTHCLLPIVHVFSK